MKRVIATLVAMCLCACASNQGVVPTYLATKTPYVAAYLDAKPPEGCRPVHIESVSRHGSRYLSDTKDADRLIEMLEEEKAKGELSQEKHLALQWAREARKPDEAGMLTRQGEREMYEFGQRLAITYKSLFALDGVFIETLAAPKKRVQDSLKHFLEGFNSVVSLPIKVADADPQVLRFFAHCKKYKEYRNGTWHPKLKNGSEFEKYVYKLCQQDFNLDAVTAADRFCALLSPEAKRMQYESARTKSYYKFGPLTDSGMACPVLEPMFARMERVTRGESVPVAHFAFGHAETVVPLGNFFELFDVALQNWNVSEVSPMGVNLQVVTYACRNDGNISYKVKLLYNEKEYPFQAEGCQGQIYCDWGIVKSYYEQRKEELDVKSCSQADWNAHCGNKLMP